MPGRLGPRFALEAVFLVALAVAMGLADLSARSIIAVMAVAWLLVALVEWLASREAEAAWRPAERAAPEPVTELVPPPDEHDEEAETGDPIAEAPAPRGRWLRRRRSEETRAER